ncbi:LysR family transcriptional regulator [Variovorax sp. KK3]|uniref:LysR family transcriptional regulator n=1 Tax=Variovorax sp. KK3 TaxID=1855728 RepID=UPI0015C2E4CD|nr:LysR family transcriptional regulator [Variovorax sp. KK3]
MPTPDIDLHLLRCLDALVTERHVTRAADRLGMSQSGMSTALARLRTVFDDPILVRTPSGMQLSENAAEIAGAARRALNEIDFAMARRGPFDAATSSMTFNLMGSDYFGLMILPGLIERVRAQAPHVLVKVASPQPARIRESLANSETDLVIGFFHDIADGLYQTVVVQETLCCVASKHHSSIQGGLSLDDYAAADHVYFGSPPEMVSSIEVMLERALPLLGIQRRSCVQVPTFGVMPRILARTDLLATMPLRVAESFAQSLPLQVLPLPFELPSLPVRAIWHERMHENHAHRWLRGLVQDVGRSL